MADKTKFASSKQKPKAARFNDAKFVNYELNVDEKRSCKQWLPSLEEYDDALLKFVDQGYRVSVKFDNYTEAYSAFGQSFDAGNINAGLILTGRGSTPAKAIKQMLYKHFLVFDQEWGGWAEPGQSVEFDD